MDKLWLVGCTSVKLGLRLKNCPITSTNALKSVLKNVLKNLLNANRVSTVSRFLSSSARDGHVPSACHISTFQRRVEAG